MEKVSGSKSIAEAGDETRRAMTFLESSFTAQDLVSEPFAIGRLIFDQFTKDRALLESNFRGKDLQAHDTTPSDDLHSSVYSSESARHR
jgi:hypothetical protein